MARLLPCGTGAGEPAILTHLVLWLGAAAVTGVLMELWAALLHGRVWHGALWRVHRSHHRGRGDVAAGAAAPQVPRGWQANDALSLLHAPVAIALILVGCRGAEGWVREVLFGVGLGMSAFGLAYVLVHDGLVHQRLPMGWLLRWRYFKRVRAAHLAHHRTGGPPYGLFLGAWALRRARDQAQRPTIAGPRRRSTSI